MHTLSAENQMFDRQNEYGFPAPPGASHNKGNNYY
jgi:hypothetical protein